MTSKTLSSSHSSHSVFLFLTSLQKFPCNLFYENGKTCKIDKIADDEFLITTKKSVVKLKALGKKIHVIEYNKKLVDTACMERGCISYLYSIFPKMKGA